MTTNKQFPNKYASPCAACGQQVAVGAGLTSRNEGEGPKWLTVHAPGTCPVVGPVAEVRVQPQAAVIAFPPTDEQADAVAKFLTRNDLVIQAGAGAGKTTVLKMIANAALALGLDGWYGAFNRAIVVDVAEDLPGNVEASTMHSQAFRAIGRQFRHRLDGRRQRAFEVAASLGLRSIDVAFGEGTKTLASGFLASRVLAAVTTFCRSADREIGRRHIGYIDGIDAPDAAGNRTYANNDRVADALLPYVVKAWADLTDPAGTLRFSHDVYLKVWSLGDPRITTPAGKQVDFILFDEAQDADPVQVAIIEHQRRYGTQVVVVGDEMQVIYDWRGAVDALARFEAMGAQVAFLTQSFRFGDAIAEVANGLLGRLDARLRITGFGRVASAVEEVVEPDAILCRTNAGAVKTMLGFIGSGRSVHLVGGGSDVAGFARGALALQEGRSTEHPELACFADWAEVVRYVDEEEQGEELRLLVKLVDEFGAADIIDALNGNAKEADADVVVSTAHKSKGREWGTVQIASDFRAPKEPGTDLTPAELRLAYVAVTRAKRVLDIEGALHFAPGWTPGR